MSFSGKQTSLARGISGGLAIEGADSQIYPFTRQGEVKLIGSCELRSPSTQMLWFSCVIVEIDKVLVGEMGVIASPQRTPLPEKSVSLDMSTRSGEPIPRLLK